MDFIAVYPAFQPVPKVAIDIQLGASAALLSRSAWGSFYEMVVGLDAAHNLSLSQLAASGPKGAFEGASGPVTSVSAGGMSAGFAAASFNDKSAREQWYSKTVYGQQLLRLWNVGVPMGTLSW